MKFEISKPGSSSIWITLIIGQLGLICGSCLGPFRLSCSGTELSELFQRSFRDDWNPSRWRCGLILTVPGRFERAGLVCPHLHLKNQLEGFDYCVPPGAGLPMRGARKRSSLNDAAHRRNLLRSIDRACHDAAPPKLCLRQPDAVKRRKRCR